MLVQLDLCVDTGGTDTMSRVLRQSSSAATRVQMLIDAMEIYGRGSSGQGCAAPAVQAAANHIMAAANNATAATAPKRAAQDDESGASHHKWVARIVHVQSWPLVLCTPQCCVLTVQDRAGTATFASMSKYGSQRFRKGVVKRSRDPQRKSRKTLKTLRNSIHWLGLKSR